MTGAVHLVYLGAEPASVLELAADGSDVTVSVVQSVDAAVDQLRRPGTDCLVVDETPPDADLGALADRLAAAVPDAPLAVRSAAADHPEIETDLDVATVPTGAPPAERLRRVQALLEEGDGGPAVGSELNSAPGEFSDTLQWPQPGRDAGVADALATSLADAPTVVDTFLNSVVDVFFVFDLDLNFRLWNDSLNEQTGYGDAEIASMTPMDLIVEEHHERALDRIETIVETGQATAEFDLRTSDGRVRPYSFTGSLIRDGEDTYISGIGRDISDRKAREAELRRERDLTSRVIETSPIAILVVDGDGRVLRMNSRATNLLDLTESDAMTSVVDSDWNLYDEDGDELDSEDHPVRRTLRTGETIYGHTHRVEIDDDERWLSTNAAPLTDGRGEVTQVVVAIEDVTELKEREQELTRRQAELDTAIAELKRSNAELERFAYVASHDLKEPLRTITNYLGLLERRYGDELDADAKDFIDYAIGGADQMRGLLDGLLKYSRTHRQADAFEPVDTAAVLETVRSNLRIAIDEADAEIRSGDLPTVLGDRNHLVQLFQNLLSNALTYSGETPPTVTVDCERDDDVYRFAVADDGPGIPPDEAERVFEIFYSGERSDSTGIGLAVCKKIVENHGGRISVDADPGEGTTFYFTLPAESATPSDPGRSLTPTVD